MGLGVAACLCLCVLLGVEKKSLVKAEEEAIYKEAEGEGKKKAEEKYERRILSMKEEQDMERTVREVAEQAAEAGGMAADTPDQIRVQETEKQLITAYDNLLKYEKDPAKAEEIRQKKAELEKTP